MTSIQRVIKYCAMGFAIALMVGILTGITAIISGIDKGVNWDGETTYINFTKEFEDIDSLDLTNYSGKMFIQVGSVNKVTVHAKNVPDTTVVKVRNNNTLYVNDETTRIWFFDLHFWEDEEENSQITIILPIDFVAKKATLDNNSGDMEVRGLYAKDLELSGGSGHIMASNISADQFDISAGSGELQLDRVQLNKGEIDSGSGLFQLTNSSISDVDIDTGSGEFFFDGLISGDNNLDGGSGSISLNIKNFADMYNLDLDAGSGGIYINGEKVDREKIKHKGAENKLEVDGGSGKITIQFTE
ncbi:MAG: DUF4097 family beta strand repeat-containing protein [Clostridiales bacterium]|nr:DUF4097 family beta strand repeat-containing protein [Clostridiales bacterium]